MGDQPKKPGTAGSRFFPRGYDPTCIITAEEGATCTASAVEQIQAELDADPVAGGKTIIATASDDGSIRSAMKHLNAVRQKKGLMPIGDEAIDNVLESVRGARTKAGTDPFSIAHREDFKLAVVPPAFGTDGTIAEYLVLPASDALRRNLVTAYGQQGAALHETAHLLMRPELQRDWDMKERVADMTMALARVARHEDGMDKKIAVCAGWRALQPGTGHSQAADDLLRLRHELATNPQKLHAEIDGKSLPELVKIAEKKILAADASYKPQGMEGSYYGMERAISILHPKPDSPPPRDIDRDAAITLLRIQMVAEHDTVKGKDNDLSRAMPGLWRAYPKAFAEAQSYMKDHYGIAVPAPPEAPKPKVKPAGRSITEQSLGM
jgi:hypothetical protein